MFNFIDKLNNINLLKKDEGLVEYLKLESKK